MKTLRKNILLEGRPGVGKTTLLIRIADHLSDLRIGGFYTEEIREKDQRVGFQIRTFTGQLGILSHECITNGPVVGKYCVDIRQFEDIGVNAMKNALKESDAILIDEIGKMELVSEAFQELVLLCLDSDKMVIATIMSRPYPFVDKIKSRPDARLIGVNLANRDSLVDLLIKEIKSQISLNLRGNQIVIK